MVDHRESAGSDSYEIHGDRVMWNGLHGRLYRVLSRNLTRSCWLLQILCSWLSLSRLLGRLRSVGLNGRGVGCHILPVNHFGQQVEEGSVVNTFLLNR